MTPVEQLRAAKRTLTISNTPPLAVGGGKYIVTASPTASERITKDFARLWGPDARRDAEDGGTDLPFGFRLYVNPEMPFDACEVRGEGGCVQVGLG